MGFFPIDLPNCSCGTLIQEAKMKLPGMKEADRVKYRQDHVVLRCPRHEEEGMKPFLITCLNCDSEIAYLYAKDESLDDFCDLHYVADFNESHWRGCFTVNISPLDLKLGFECACGVDTRDFRANRNYPTDKYLEIEKLHAEGRAFGSRKSKFIAKPITEARWLKLSTPR